MLLEGIEVRGLGRLAHGRHGAIEPFYRLRLMEPQLDIGDGLGGRLPRRL